MFSLEGQCGFIDKTGKYAINPQFDSSYDYAEGLAAVQIGFKWGFINKTGVFVINPQFDDAVPFSEGLAYVRIGNNPDDWKWGFIDKTGQYIINPQFTQEDFGFIGELAPVYNNLGFLYINKQGCIVWTNECAPAFLL